MNPLTRCVATIHHGEDMNEHLGEVHAAERQDGTAQDLIAVSLFVLAPYWPSNAQHSRSCGQQTALPRTTPVRRTLRIARKPKLGASNNDYSVMVK